ncbi:hypothetical protein [Clavibacter michiganensis]|uniref:hypothetical protein n=1 Tax=Clavibacter michiganensis TaxID=28447 RepID=UPI00292FD9CE|nr:hypothetical protein [Clavibacter michiganensis]
MDLFTWINNMSDKATTALNGAIIVIGIAIFVIGAIRGKGKIPTVLLSLVAAGLFVWGGLSGVYWVKDSTKSTIEHTASAFVAPESPGGSFSVHPRDA